MTAALVAVLFGEAQAFAQAAPVAPAPAPAPAKPPTPGPVTPAPAPAPAPGPVSPAPAPAPAPTPAPPVSQPPATPSPATPPGGAERAPGDVPTAVEAPPGTPPPTGDVSTPPPAEPAAPLAPTPPATPDTVAPPPAADTGDGNILVKDEAQANALRKKGLAVLVGGGIITVAGLATTIAFTIRGTQYEGLLQAAQEDYNVRNCVYKLDVADESPCGQLAGRIDSHGQKIDFADRATKAGGAAMAAGVLVMVAGGIIYRLGIKKLKSGDIASRRFQMAPTAGRGFGGFVLQGRF